MYENFSITYPIHVYSVENVYHSIMINHGMRELKEVMAIHVSLVTATTMPPAATTMPLWTHIPMITPMEGEEFVSTV